MNVQLPFVVEGVLILIAGTFGILLDKKGKPFGTVKLILHLFFAVWFAVGVFFIFDGLSRMPAATPAIWIPVGLMGLSVLIQLVTGITMIAAKWTKRTLPSIHLTSAIVLLAADICALIIASQRS